MWQHKWALWSGFLGATASCFVKMGVGDGSTSPLLRVVQIYICEQPIVHAWLIDLDDIVLRGIHRVLGELMIQYHINLMPFWEIIKTEVLEEVAIRLHLFEVDYCQLFIVLPLRIICIVAMLITNVYMIASFLRGIQESGSVGGTSLSTAANFASSAIYGRFLWDEQMNARWCFGFGCVLVGVVVLSSETTTAVPSATSEDTRSNTNGKARNDIRRRIEKYLNNAKSSSKTVSPPPPREIYTKTRSGPLIPKKDTSTDKLPSSRTSLANNSLSRYKRPETPLAEGGDSKSTMKVTSSPERRCIRIPQPSSPARKTKEQLKPESALEQYYSFKSRSLSSPSNLINRSFVNECILCEGSLFDKSTGDSRDAIADLSLKTCFHLFHSRCLKQASKSYGNACPICEKPLAMWTASKQAAQFPGFWLERVENFLQAMSGAPKDTVSGKDACLPATVVREYFQQQDDLTESQKLYIQDDPTGMDRGLQAAFEWGGHIDFNRVPKGHLGFSKVLRTRGIWKYDRKKDDLWLWEWGLIHPRQRCDQCQLIKRPLTVECQETRGSSEAAFYCSELCAKRDRQRHKQTCDTWRVHGPKQ